MMQLLFMFVLDCHMLPVSINLPCLPLSLIECGHSFRCTCARTFSYYLIGAVDADGWPGCLDRMAIGMELHACTSS